MSKQVTIQLEIDESISSYINELYVIASDSEADGAKGKWKDFRNFLTDLADNLNKQCRGL